MQNIVLVGPMGAGKSTVGKQLAAKLHYEFIDTDHFIEAKAGADIPWIFDVEGEAGFRSRESATLDALVGKHDVVIATGGGIVTMPENIAKLKKLGKVYYLTASLEQLYERTFKDKKRPLLQVPDPQKRIAELVEQRDPLYRSVADRVLKTDGRGTRWIVSTIVKDIAGPDIA